MKNKISLLTVLLVLTSFLAHAATIQITTNTTVAAYSGSEVIIPGKADLHITSPYAKTALVNSTVKLNSLDSWLIFDNIKPSVVIDSLLSYVYAGANPAVNKNNARVAIYKNGAAVMPHPSGFQPLTIYSERSFKGDSSKYNISTYYKGLGTMDNKLRSFKLKRGYMATLANNSDGGGYSRVFIADKSDLIIDSLSYLLDQSVSFIRVFEWEFVSKKGKAGWDPNVLDATTYYDWNIGGSSSENVEYVAIRQNGGWPGWDAINAKQGITHCLGFNEPDHTDQSNMTMAGIKAQWPSFMNSGLRIGSPAWASAWAGLSDGGNLFDFVDWCDATGKRLDFIALHCYWGAKSPSSWYSDLKYIHERTGRPLWITEWNNGANWTTEYWPDADRTYTTNNANKQLNDIKGILQVFDTASFIERYFIYDWVQDCRAMVLSSGVTLAGQYYKANKSNFAFTPALQKIPGYVFDLNPTLTVSYSTAVANITVTDKNSDFCLGFIMERKIDSGNYEVVADVDDKTIKTFVDSLNPESKMVRYRVKTKLANGSLSNYSNEIVVSMAKGKSVQYGNITTSNIDYNSVFYSQAFDNFPAIVLGGAKYVKLSALVSPRVKFVNKNQRFTVQASPWAYQNLSVLPDDVTFPYFVCSPGKLKFGNLLADAGRNTVSATTWTTVNFDTTFSTVPVVFANQYLASTTNATVVRIKDITTTGFKALIKKEGAITTVGNSESVTWVAIEPGIGLLDSDSIYVGRTSNAPVSTGVYKLDTLVIAGHSVAESDVFLSQFQTCNDESTAQLGMMLYKGSPWLMKQVEKSITYSGVKNEDAGWIYIKEPKVITGLNEIENSTFSIFPNPSSDFITVQSNEKISKYAIYNALGLRIRSAETIDNCINIQKLAAGVYVLQVEGVGTQSFIKN